MAADGDRANLLGGVILLRHKYRLLIALMCFSIVTPALFAQGMTLTREDQIGLVAPTSSGETGLFTTVTADTLHRGDLSFGIYLNDYDLLAGPARQFAPLTARPYRGCMRAPLDSSYHSRYIARIR